MELEEAEEEEWETTNQYLSKPNANNSSSKVNCVFKRGLALGKKILVAGVVASSAPFVVPPLVVASAIGLTVSVPYALFLASHTCTESLMSRLLPLPTPQPHAHQLLDDMCFQPDIDIAYKSKEEQILKDEVKRDNSGIVSVNEENMTLGNDYQEGVVKEGDEEELSSRMDEKLGDEIYGGMEGYLSGESKGEQPISVGHGNEIEEFGVTTVVLEEFEDEEPSLQKDDDGKFGDEIYGRTEGYLNAENIEEQPISATHGNEIEEFGVTPIVLEECDDGESSLRKDDDEKLGDEIYGGTEGYLNGESNREQPISVGHGNEIEEFEVTTVVLEECDDGEPSLRKDDNEKLGDEIYGGMEGYRNGENIREQPISVGHVNEIESGVTTVVLEERNDEESSHQKDDDDDDDEKLGDKIYGEMAGYLSGESNVEQPISVVHANEIEFGATTTTVVLEECEDEVKEGDIEEEELQRETTGLLEKIRDEGRTDMRGEYVEETHRGTNESDKNIGPVVENMEVPQEDMPSLEIEGEMRNDEDLIVREEKVQSRNDDESNDKDVDTIICHEAESGEPPRGILEVDSSNDSQKPMAETCDSELLDGTGIQCETILVESIGDMLIETQVLNISVVEDPSEVTNDKTATQTTFEEELEPRILQKGKSDDNISDFLNQETPLHEDNILMDLADTDAREIANESGLRLCDENITDPPGMYSDTIDLHEGSSNVMSDLHTDSLEVLVSSVELESRLSESSLEKNIISPSEEVLLNEGDIRKQINVIRKIIGYEGTSQASCADELKALYVFTGVEPPSFVKEDPFDPAEINEKLHFLMSIVGIKPNVP